ncbi:T9SS type A sorting domain-containing protein [Pontibacter mangrovi]|nr:T9SS type A sorting domain-containing protein [Pontibacter mangrovi]
MIKKFTLTLLACFTAIQLMAQDKAGFSSVTELTPIPITKSTEGKSQSKVWEFACTQWAVLPDREGTHLWRLDSNKWKKMLNLSQNAYLADCKVDGNLVHVLLFTNKGKSLLTSLEFDAATNSYVPWTSRPTPSKVALSRHAEEGTIDIDSTGRMWLASDDSTSITVRWSDSPYTDWSEPITLATGIDSTDMGAVIAMPGKIGVMWTNLLTQRFGFRTHVDGAPPTEWSADEVPASQSALDIYLGMADDHLNLALGSDGTLYCAVKTEYDTPGLPKIALLIRRPSGTWDDLYGVAEKGTRPVVVLNEEEEKLRIIYTRKDVGSDIVYKETSTRNIAFSDELQLLKGKFNDVTSSKANFSSSVVVLASDANYAAGVLATDGPQPESCTAAIHWKLYPNPFSTTTKLYFSLPHGGRYAAVLYDTRGAKITSLKQGTTAAGEWNSIPIDGANLATGMYLIRVQTDDVTESMKVVLSR